MALQRDVRMIRILYIYEMGIIYYTEKRRVETLHARRLYTHIIYGCFSWMGFVLCVHIVYAAYTILYIIKRIFCSCFYNVRGKKTHQTIHYYCIVLYVTNTYNVKRLNRSCSRHYIISYYIQSIIILCVLYTVLCLKCLYSIT